jgi:hypothetical protein
MTTAADVSPGDRPLRGIRRYWRAFLAFAGSELADYAETFAIEWRAFLTVSFLVAVPVVASLHTIEVFGLRATGSLLLESLALVPATALAAALVVLLGWAYLSIGLNREREDGRETHPYVVAALAFALAIGVCVEAFAGVTTLHLQGVEPGSSLWETEQAYIWHLLDAVPLLGLPAAIGWSEPSAGHDHASGALLLVFKLVVIAPMLRLAVAGYYALDRHVRERLEDQQLAPNPSIRQRVDLFLETGDVLRVLPVLALGAAGTFVLWTFLFDPSRWPTHALEDHIPNAVHVHDMTVHVNGHAVHVHGVAVSLEWATTVPQWLGVGAILLIGFVLVAAALAYGLRPQRLWVIGAVCGVYACVLMLLTEGAVAVLLALAHVGAISTEPAIPAQSQVASAFSFLVRPVADAVPGFDIPATLNWSPEQRFVGTVGGVVQLFYKFLFFLIVLFPMARAIRLYWHGFRVRPQAGLAAAGEFADAFREAHAALDRAEQDLLRKPVRDLPRPATEPAHKHLRRLSSSLKGVTALFGSGTESDHAKNVVRTAGARMDVIRSAQFAASGIRPQSAEALVSTLARARRASEAAANAYAKAAAVALREATPTVRSQEEHDQ